MKISVLFLAAGLSFAVTGCNQTAANQTANRSTAPANTSAPTTATNTPAANRASAPAQETASQMKRISVEEAKAAVDAGKAVVVDTRSADQYAQEHVKGSLNIPISEFETRYKELPKDKQIIAYCS